MSGTLDNAEIPFVDIQGYSDQLGCAQACENFLGFNGCSNSKCWCTPENFVSGGEQSMAACLPTVCSSSQVAAAETLAASIFSSYCTSKGFTDLAQVTAVPSSSSTSSSAGVSSPTPSATKSRSSSLATTTSSNKFSPTGASPGNSSQAPTSHRSGLSSGASGAIGAVAVVIVLGIAAALYIFMRRKKRKAANPLDYPHEEARPGPHELEPKDITVKDTQVHKFSAKPSDGLPAGHQYKEMLRAYELEPKEARIQAVSPQFALEEGMATRDSETRDAHFYEAFVQPGELGPAQAWELDGSQR